MLKTYAVPMGTPNEALHFTLKANGQTVGLYSDFNEWMNECAFGYFDFDDGDNITVRVETDFDFNSVEALPERLNITPEASCRSLEFKIEHPHTDISLVFDGDYQNRTLHIFTNPLDHDAPTESGDNLIYIAPGYHKAEEFDGQLTLRSNMTLYIAGGAVLDCPVGVDDAENALIAGSGVIMISEDNGGKFTHGSIALTIANSHGVEVRNIIAAVHKNRNWTTHIWYSSEVAMRNYRVMSLRYASVDGVDITNSRGVTLEGCFIRSCDDAVTIKGMSDKTNPAECPPNENITVVGCTLWNDCNSAMVVGEESRAVYYDNIKFRDIDVLYSYDDRDHHEKLDERSVMSIVSLHGTFFRNITWENIRINQCQRLVCFTFKDDFWFGTVEGDQSFAGGIDNVQFNNIVSKSTQKSAISGKLILDGHDDSKMIENIVFNNFIINGVKLGSLSDPAFEKVRFTKNISFR